MSSKTQIFDCPHMNLFKWRIELKIKMIVLFLFILMINVNILSYKIDFERIKITGDEFLQVSISFCVTEDNLFLVIDFKRSNVKI